MKTEKFNINGMGCMGCANTIQNTLSELEGVKDAQVDLANKTVKINYDPQIVSKESMQASVDKAGYELVIK
ncbi:heavy-metal-associated domain-containing protein [Aerococcaceae bacterium WGS1372]